MLEIINQRYMQFLFEIGKRPRNISELAKNGDFTLSVASTLISRWSREEVVLKEKSEGGKEITITLTPYGVSQVKLLKLIYNNHLNRINPKSQPKLNPDPENIYNVEGGENGNR